MSVQVKSSRHHQVVCNDSYDGIDKIIQQQRSQKNSIRANHYCHTISESGKTWLFERKYAGHI